MAYQRGKMDRRLDLGRIVRLRSHVLYRRVREYAAYFAQMRQAISDARLDAYRTSRLDREVELLARYAWNMALSEALYPSLQALEVTLRNAVHDAIAARYGARWFDDPVVLPTVNGRAMLQEALQKVARARRQPETATRAVTDFPDRIVAATDLGFWTHLFNDPFEQGPGKPKPLWPALIPNVFPYAPRFFREHRKLGRRLDAIRVFRNRVFHHEPISRDPRR